MKHKNYYLLLLTALVLMTTGCDELLSGKKPNTVVLDMSAIVKSSGQDEVIKQKMEETKTDLGKQLNDTATNLEKELMEVRAKFGKTLSKEEEEKFQKMAYEANQQVRQMQTFAQQKAQQYESGLYMELRKQIQPVAEEVARKRGASMVQIMSPSVLWVDGSIDITDEVIAEINARPTMFDSSPVDVSSEDAVAPTEQPTDATSDEMPAEAVVNEMPAESMGNEMPTESMGNEMPAEAVANEVSTEAVAEEVPAEKATDMVPEKITTDKVK